jgi:serine/threonine-protein phosphatase PGAM5
MPINVEARYVRAALTCALLLIGSVPAAVGQGSTAAIRTVYLIRHGAYLPDPKAKPQSGPGLSTLGIAQARLVGTRLRAMPIAFDSLTSSPMTRAQQTAAIVHEQIADVPTSSSPLLSECTPPARIELRDAPAALSACKQRLDAAFEKFFTPASDKNRNDALVCHGNVIRYLTTIVQVLGKDTYRVIAVGDTGHIPATLQSWGDDFDPHLIAPAIDGFAAAP